MDDSSFDKNDNIRNSISNGESQNVASSKFQWTCKSKRPKSVSEFSSNPYELCAKSEGDCKSAITATLTEDEAYRFLSEDNTVNVSKSSHNEYFEENINLAEYIKENFKDFRFLISHDENMQRLVPKLTVYKKTCREGKVKNKLVLAVDYYLKVYCNNFEYDIVRRFFIPEKETFNNLELFNLGFASEEKLEQLCKLMEETFKRNPKRFRSIIIYGGVRKSKGKIKLMNEEKIKKILSIISKFKTGSILFIDFELSWDIFVQIIQMMKWRFVIMFLNWLIVSKNIIESYVKINNKSSRLIKFCNCNFESNYLDDSKISDEKSTELSYVIKYICLNKYWEKHLHKIFLYFFIILNWCGNYWFEITFVRLETISTYLRQFLYSLRNHTLIYNMYINNCTKII